MEDKFTSREVIAIVEDLKGEFRTVAESVVGLREDVTGLKERVFSLEGRVGTLEDVIRVAVPGIAKRVDRIEAKLNL